MRTEIKWNISHWPNSKVSDKLQSKYSEILHGHPNYDLPSKRNSSEKRKWNNILLTVCAHIIILDNFTIVDSGSSTGLQRQEDTRSDDDGTVILGKKTVALCGEAN